jgi:hypothetical protein
MDPISDDEEMPVFPWLGHPMCSHPSGGPGDPICMWCSYLPRGHVVGPSPKTEEAIKVFKKKKRAVMERNASRELRRKMMKTTATTKFDDDESIFFPIARKMTKTTATTKFDDDESPSLE